MLIPFPQLLTFRPLNLEFGTSEEYSSKILKKKCFDRILDEYNFFQAHVAFCLMEKFIWIFSQLKFDFQEKARNAIY